MNLSRRCFLGGVVSLAAFDSLGAAKGHSLGGAPRLKIGVVSDVHIALGNNGKLMPDNTEVYFENALKWYREQEVDVIMATGDLADCGTRVELEAMMGAWNRVFPNNRGKNGRKVEKVFITGNHDWEGWKYGPKGKTRTEISFPDPEEYNRQVLRKDMAKRWEEITGEKYEKIFLKKIKGYTFIGYHWEDSSFRDLPAFMEKHAGEIDKTKPFFYGQHAHLKDTCFGPWAWGHCSGVTTECLKKFPNCVAFSGHAHYCSTDERAIWQDGFTSIGLPSLRYAGVEGDEFKGTELRYRNKHKICPAWGMQSGLLVSVYDDAIVYQKRDFSGGMTIGDDWVQPIGRGADKKAFSFEKRAQLFEAPQFPPDAKIEVKEGNNIVIPACIPDKRARCFRYELEVITPEGEKKVHNLYPLGWGRAEAHSWVKTASMYEYDPKEIDIAKPMKLTPINCFGKRGKPISN